MGIRRRKVSSAVGEGRVADVDSDSPRRLRNQGPARWKTCSLALDVDDRTDPALGFRSRRVGFQHSEVDYLASPKMGRVAVSSWDSP